MFEHNKIHINLCGKCRSRNLTKMSLECRQTVSRTLPSRCVKMLKPQLKFMFGWKGIDHSTVNRGDPLLTMIAAFMILARSTFCVEDASIAICENAKALAQIHVSG